MSLLLSQGHVHARSYPLGKVSQEVRIANERTNQMLASEAVLMSMVVSSMFDKASGKAFWKQIKRLQGG